MANSNRAIGNLSDLDMKGYQIITVLNIVVEPLPKPPSNILPNHFIEDLLNQSQKYLKKVGSQIKKGKKSQPKKKNDIPSKTNIGLKFNKSIELLRK